MIITKHPKCLIYPIFYMPATNGKADHSLRAGTKLIIALMYRTTQEYIQAYTKWLIDKQYLSLMFSNEITDDFILLVKQGKVNLSESTTAVSN